MTGGYQLVSFALAYGGIGLLAWGADHRVGVGVRGWFVDLASPEPLEHHDGFLVGRGAGTQLAWALALAAGVAACSLSLHDAPWYTEVPRMLGGALACFLGMQVVPGFTRARARLTEAREGLRARIEAARAAPGAPVENPEPSEMPRAPASPALRRRQKIDTLDALLGRRTS